MENEQGSGYRLGRVQVKECVGFSVQNGERAGFGGLDGE